MLTIYDLKPLGDRDVMAQALVFIAVGLFLDGVVEDQRAVIRFDGADGRLDQCPQVARGVIGPRQEPGDLVMADRIVQQPGKAGRGGLRERTDQVVAVQI